MYAVIRTGGKQQKVKPGDVIEVELLHADGDTVTFQPLLVVDDDGTTHVGTDIQRSGSASRRATRSTSSSTRASRGIRAGRVTVS